LRGKNFRIQLAIKNLEFERGFRRVCHDVEFPSHGSNVGTR
jgi:hypothetical protein